MPDVLVHGAVCLKCGVRMVGVYWDGDEGDDRRFPVAMPAEDVRAITSSGCYHCGGQVQVEFEPARTEEVQG